MVTNILLIVCGIMTVMAVYCLIPELFKMDDQLDYNARETYKTRELKDKIC